MQTLDEPKYVGDWNLEKSWRWAPRLAGKPIEQIEEVFIRAVAGTLDEAKANIVTSHGGRKGLDRAIISDRPPNWPGPSTV